MCLLSECYVLCVRHEDPGESAAGHAADVGERAAAVLLRLLHLRHHRRAAVGWTSAQPLLSGGELNPVSPGSSSLGFKVIAQ